MKKILFLIVIIAITTSCNFNYINREKDKKDAEAVAMVFYDKIHEKDYNTSLERMFSKEFLAITPSEKLNKTFLDFDSILGNIDSMELIGWETFCIEGSNAKSEYALSYNVKREKYNSIENFTMKKEEDTIKILSYHVQSDGFLGK